MPSVEQLCKPGSMDLAIHIGASAADAITLFQRNPDLRLLPVLTDTGAPVGAIFEEDVRQILFNPYGHALLRNPSFGRTLIERVRPCPTVDSRQDLGALLAVYAQAGGQEGMIVTRNGRYVGLIENRALVAAAGAYELDRIHRREQDLDRLREAGMAFEVDIDRLASGLTSVADDLGHTATATAKRGEATEQRASLVAAAALQTSSVMRMVATSSGDLASALDVLHGEAIQAKTAAQEAVALVTVSARRADALYQSTNSIETITGLIDALASKVNMLAINATIEAARAGESGRGFGIVANEVRGLASQTREAAVEIARHAIDVRTAVAEVVAGNDGIERVISGVERISLTVETTVQAQRAMTIEIAEGADQAATSSQEIQSNAGAIHQTARLAAAGASEMERTAQSLTTSSEGLMKRVLAFLDDVRAA
ncbi:methyl-accepting chemotaxis protein [Sphingomonas abietis]|uniref:Methyl-accepting chemotaxis protein n=1 Tax=Sphingomonas abietis TaxID=3012344 RepID=A0ABY7NPD9_9SPHN|nr:methyl-accepting chemotaxis protein [Sphingomonas abietis]WBO23397.1 methyl-accepting chemotaxis protein [Sphingomonas abietis]